MDTEVEEAKAFTRWFNLDLSNKC